MKWKTRLIVLGFALVALALLMWIVALWWWALAGMTEEVGLATFITASVLFSVGVPALGAGICLEVERR